MSLVPAGTPIGVDLICEVLDNFGDAGISWRLACQLAGQWQAEVRLYIDQPALVALWHEQATARGAACPRIIDLSAPDFYADRLQHHRYPELIITMLGSATPVVVEQVISEAAIAWVRYEYLSAEAWIDGFHGLPSLKPRSGATEWFYYPGFTESSGGLLREPGLAQRLDDFGSPCPEHAGPRAQWLNEHGLATPDDHLRICLFGYPDASTRAFLSALNNLAEPVTVLLSESLADALDISGREAASPGQPGFRIHAWLDQPDFDLLLASCDLNIVRGEDSWLRAQWAGRPMLWQPYRVPDQTHLDKLTAFLDRLLEDAPEPASEAIRDLMMAVNGRGDPALSLGKWLRHRRQVLDWHLAWRNRLAAQSSLTERLASFCRNKLQLEVYPSPRTTGAKAGESSG